MITAKERVAGVESRSGSEASVAGSDANRSETEVRAILDSVGRSEPEWLAATPLVFPNTLDLNWPIPPPQPWNNQRNVGQYIWDRINPNSRQWQSGVRFMYHLLSLHAADSEAIEFTRIGTKADDTGNPIRDRRFPAPVVLADKCVGCGLCQTRCYGINVAEESLLEASAIVIQAGPGKEDRIL